MVHPIGGREARKLEQPIQRSAWILFFVAFSNRETTKRREFHEMFESRISRILWDFAEISFIQRDSYNNPLRAT